jgi:hypothetical protein
MRGISERTVLLRASAETPQGLKLATLEGRQGWNYVRTGDAQRLAKKVKAHNWQFIAITDRLMASGIGATPPKARGCALDRALGRLGEQVNAVEIICVQAIRYPWFCLARITLCAYRVQEDATLQKGAGMSGPVVPQTLLVSSDSAPLAFAGGSPHPLPPMVGRPKAHGNGQIPGRVKGMALLSS